MSESGPPRDLPKRPTFGQPETGRPETTPKRKPNEMKPIELGLDIPRLISTKKDKEDELTIPFNSTQINPDPEKIKTNPYISFEEKQIVIHGHTYGYGAGNADHTQVDPKTSIRFLTPPKRNEGNWSWFVTFGEGKTGYIWTSHRKEGTLITYEKNKPPLVNFIVDDII